MLLTLDGAFYRRLAVTAAALAVYRLGCAVPVPGLSPNMVGELLGSNRLPPGSLSVCALGVMPLVTVLILAELLRTIAPGLRRWEQASPGNRELAGYAIVTLALATAAVQATGLAAGLEGFAGLVIEPGGLFRTTTVATMVGGVALLIALASIIDRAGIGYGVLLLFLVPTLVELPLNLALIADAYGSGTYPFSSIVLAGLFTALSVAAIAAILLAARGAEAVTAACIWPLLIAYTLLAWVLVGIGMAVTGGNVDQAIAFMAPGGGVRYVALAAIIILTVWLYIRSNRSAGLECPVPAAPIAVVLAAIALAAEVLQSQLATALPLGAVHLVVAAVVATRILMSLRSPAGKAAEEAAQSSGLNR
jgi:preprotein translocase subunit SecY